MLHTRVFIVVSTITVSITMLIACGDGESSIPIIEEPDAARAPEASLSPVDGDAGKLDSDAAPTKPHYDASDEPVVCSVTPCVTQLVAGANYFCALLSDGSVRCWGLDGSGSLGRGVTDGGAATGSRPMPVVGITSATQISASSRGSTTCARSADGRLQCWGDNTNGQLGLQVSPAVYDGASHATPMNVALTAEIARVDVGPVSVYALGANGDVYCWGYNAQGQLPRPDAGTSSSSDYYGPSLCDLRDYDLRRIVAGNQSVFGLTRDRQLLGWGRVTGRDTSLVYAGPSLFQTLKDVTGLDIGGSWNNGHEATYCAIATGDVYCWGEGRSGGLGTGVVDVERLPVLAGLPADGKAYPQQLALAETRSCVRMTDGTVLCSGDDGLGQLGRGDAGTAAFVFGRATAFEEYAVQVAVSSSTTCALVQGGKVMCWGGNENGELGQGTMDSDAHPSPVTVVFQ